jgi:hypothetical protein
MIYSVYLVEHFFKTWVKSYAFYVGDLSSVDVKTDWRFSEKNNKRKQAIFLGLSYDLDFPVVYPLTLLNGVTIERLEHGEPTTQEGEE